MLIDDYIAVQRQSNNSKSTQNIKVKTTVRKNVPSIQVRTQAWSFLSLLSRLFQTGTESHHSPEHYQRSGLIIYLPLFFCPVVFLYIFLCFHLLLSAKRDKSAWYHLHHSHTSRTPQCTTKHTSLQFICQCCFLMRRMISLQTRIWRRLRSRF